jgi:AraC-like DNA-binding protein
VSRLGEKTTALKPLFPGADERFAAKLTGQSDEVIFAMLEHLLRNKRPVPDKNLDLVTRIMVALEHDETLQTVAAVARVFGKSERSIQLLFQTYVGVGLKWVITRKRLLETVRQVRTHARSNWVEAAAELGYSSQSHFVREFKRIIGRTPSQYLRAMTPAP